MSKTLYLNEARIHTFTGNAQEALKLVPGRNTVEEKLYEAVRGKSKAFKEACEDGTILVQGAKLNVPKMKAEQVAKLIELETTVDGVQDIMDQEEESPRPRVGVMKAGATKIEAIEKALEDAGGESGGEGGGDNS